MGSLAQTARADIGELQTFSPDEGDETIQFKAATVCHDNARDLYGIAVVFERFDWYLGGTYDQLWYLQVEGNSGSSEYGRVVSDQVITAAGRIDNVDCTTDGGENVYVAYDRQWESAQWVRIDGDEIWGPVDIEVDANCPPYTHRPRIAHDGEGRIAVAVEGWHYETEVEYQSCEVCTQQYDADWGEEIPGSNAIIWPDIGVNHTDYDIEWGDDAFIAAVPYWPDNLPDNQYISTFRVDLDNTLDPSTGQPPKTILQDTGEMPEPAWPERVKLVRSTSEVNEIGAMFLRTDTGSYWLDGAGALLDDPLEDPSDPQMAVCEYWGSDPAVAHTFTKSLRGEYVGVYPSGYFSLYWAITRNHYGLDRDYPYESWDVLDDFVPEACDGSDTYDDPEVVLVTRPTSADASVYWTILQNDD